MKNFVILFMIILTLSLSTSAQDNLKTIKIGLLGGINLAYVNSNSNQDQKTNIVPAFGLTTEFPLIHGLSLKVDPMYLNKGAKLIEGEDPMEEPEALLKSSYIELPVLLKYSFFEGINPYLIAGMTLDYQLDTRLDVMFPGLETTIEMKDVTENFGFGISFGCGIEIPINSINLFYDCRYTLGVTNMQKTGNVMVDVGNIQIPIDYDKDENGYKNRGIQFLIGVSYSIK